MDSATESMTSEMDCAKTVFTFSETVSAPVAVILGEMAFFFSLE